MKPYLNIQEAIRDFSDRIERLEAAIKSEREKVMRAVTQEATCDIAGCHNDAKVQVLVRLPGVKIPLGDLRLDLCATHQGHGTTGFNVGPKDVTLERVWYS